MRIAVIKPDWRIRGGFEVVLDRIETDLRTAGHEIERVEIDVPSLPRMPFDFEVPDELWSVAPEWFTHLTLMQTFRELDVSWADLVISTQPPSYAVKHPRHLALFYHHARAFYDLEHVWIKAGFAPELLHSLASALLRRAETDDFDDVTHFLAGSERIVQRLHKFQGDDLPISLYQAAGPAVDEEVGSFEHVLCVSRHEFTKRTELAVLGIASAGGVSGVLAGSGGRLPFVRALSTRLAAGMDPADLTDEDIWLNSGVLDQPVAGPTLPNIDLRGRVEDAQLARLYRDALCIVAPAYDEDDGLTVAEAMSHGKPVIVCRDGGGLGALVEDGVNGFVVEPTADGIAGAISALADDRELARRMGVLARETARERSPERATGQLMSAVEIVMSAG